jgi:hypothetical protein
MWDGSTSYSFDFYMSVECQTFSLYYKGADHLSYWNNNIYSFGAVIAWCKGEFSSKTGAGFLRSDKSMELASL